jgi:hypothetical protein
LVQCQRRALQDGGGIGPWGIHILAEEDRSVVHVEGNKDVGRHAVHKFIRDNKNLSQRLIDDWSGSNADRGIDVPARQVTAGHWDAHCGVPQHRTGIGCQRVDRVGFGGYVHPSSTFERLTVDFAVNDRRSPG